MLEVAGRPRPADQEPLRSGELDHVRGAVKTTRQRACFSTYLAVLPARRAQDDELGVMLLGRGDDCLAGPAGADDRALDPDAVTVADRLGQGKPLRASASAICASSGSAAGTSITARAVTTAPCSTPSAQAVETAATLPASIGTRIRR